jgi:DNA polymerase-3 subunit epsilon
MKKILWLDTETTGIDPLKNGIIQIAGIIEINGIIKEKFELFNNPIGKLIEDSALEVNKKTREDIAKYPSPRECYKSLLNIFSKYIDKFDKNDKFVIAGHNVKFDFDFLYSFFKGLNDNYFFSWIQASAYIDTVYLITILQHLGKIPILENRKNETISKYFGENTDNLHDAVKDIEVTRNNYYNMIKLLEAK